MFVKLFALWTFFLGLLEEDLLSQTVTKTSFELHEEFAPYPATLLRIEVAEGKFGQQLKWIFLEDKEKDQGNGQDGQDRETWHFTGPKITLHPKNKVRQFYEDLTGSKVVEGQPVDLRGIFGARVNLFFEHYEDGEGQKRDKVFKVRPLEDK